MNIFLTGGGDQEHFKKLDARFIEKLPLESKLLVLPQACDENDHQDVLERIEETFFHKKVLSVELGTELNSMTSEKLSEFHAIIIEGGNTFQLIRAIRDSSFNNLLKSFAHEKGKLIYADSAGAILLGASVKTAFLGDEGDEDHLKLQDYRGLDLLEPWSVHAHHEPDDFDDLNDLLYEEGSPIIALAEEAGVHISDDQMLSLGSQSAELITFSGREVLSSDEVLRF